jgi:hypothetical protein
MDTEVEVAGVAGCRCSVLGCDDEDAAGIAAAAVVGL